MLPFPYFIDKGGRGSVHCVVFVLYFVPNQYKIKKGKKKGQKTIQQHLQYEKLNSSQM